MKIVICSSPSCQTSAGCKCITSWKIPTALPLEGYAMIPTPNKATRAASVICGHDYIQRMTEGEQTEFYIFVKEVLGDKYV